MTSDNETPTSKEIKDQLDRMLAALRFRNAPNRADFLALVVRRALQGKKTPGHVVLKELFPERSGTDVRQTALNLRTTLKEYHAEEGREDLVLITLPKPPRDKRVKLREGEAYTPGFSYNPNHAVGKEFRLGEYYRTRGRPEDLAQAFNHYTVALTLVPNHIGATIGLAEVLGHSLDWDASSIEKVVRRAATLLDSVYDRASNFWRLHAVGGLVFTKHGNFQGAEISFNKALCLDRQNTEEYPAYFEFLFKSGKQSEALRLARKNRDAHAESVAAHINCAFTLMCAHEYQEAEATIQYALAMDPNNYAAHLVIAGLHVRQKRIPEAAQHIEKMKELLDGPTYRRIRDGFDELVDSG